MNLIISLVHWSMHSIIESLCKLILINFSALLIDLLVKDSPVPRKISVAFLLVLNWFKILENAVLR